MEKINTPSAHALFHANSAGGDYALVLDKNTVQLIRQNFDLAQPILPIIVAGNMGTGKSTWLNVLRHLMDDQSSQADAFKTGNDMVTVTEGIWVFTKPLYWDKNKERQILLIDMEGQGGIKEVEQEKTDAMLKKLYLLGLTLASAFVLHVAARPTATEMELLKKTFLDYQQVADKIGVQLPPVTLFLSQASQANQAEQLKQRLQTSVKFPVELIQNIRFQPQQKLPSEFTEGKDYSCLGKAEAYIKEIQIFMKEQGHQNKRRIITCSEMTAEQFLDIVENAYLAINSPKFEQFFASNLGSFVRKVLAPKVKQMLNEFDIDTQQLAQHTDVNKPSLDMSILNTHLFDCFKSFVEDSFMSSVIHAAEQEINQHKEILKTGQESIVFKAQSTFIQRKAEASQGEMKKQYELMNNQMKEQQKIQQEKYLQTLKEQEEKLAKQAEQHSKQIEESRKAADEALLKAQQNSSANLELLKKLTELTEQNNKYQKELEEKNKKKVQEEKETLTSPIQDVVSGYLELDGKELCEPFQNYVNYKSKKCIHKIVVDSRAENGRIVDGTVVRIKTTVPNGPYDTFSGTMGSNVEFDVEKRTNDKQKWVVRFAKKDQQNIYQHEFKLQNFHWTNYYIMNCDGSWVQLGFSDTRNICRLREK